MSPDLWLNYAIFSGFFKQFLTIFGRKNRIKIFLKNLKIQKKIEIKLVNCVLDVGMIMQIFLNFFRIFYKFLKIILLKKMNKKSVKFDKIR